MKNAYSRFINFTILSVLMPFVYGCGGGGGGGSSLSGLTGGVDGGSSIGGVDGGSTIGGFNTFASISPDGGQSLASIHNPEPATMLLISGGLAAMAFYKNRQRK